MPRRHLPKPEVDRAVGLLQAGCSQRRVATELGVSQSVVGRLWHRYLETGSSARRPQSGRPRATTERQDRSLVLMAKRRRFDSATTLNRDFRETSNTTISAQTVRNRLHAADLHARRPVVRPPLTVRHRRDRLQFAQERAGWRLNDYRNILFTDESKFCLDFHDGRRRVWRTQGERFSDCCIAEHDRFGGGSVMAWGGISYDGRTDLYVINNGTLTGLRYRDEILERFVLPYAGAIGDGFVLMDDNARPHRANVVNAYLETAGIDRMYWPAKSPDLNPIEHVWDILQRKLSARARKPSTTAELAVALVDEWAQISRVEIRKLIRSLPKRFQEVVQARGGHTHY